MARKAISRTALWAIIAVVIIVVVVGGVAAYYATRPPPPKTTTTTTTPTPTHAIVGQITIGMDQALTGPVGPSGESLLWGAQLAINQINSGGGIYLANGPNGPGNYTLNLVWQDDQSVPANVPVVLTSLITQYHPAAIIATVQPGESMAGPVVTQYDVPLIENEFGVDLTTVWLNGTATPYHTIYNYEPSAYSQSDAAVEFLYYEWTSVLHERAPMRIVLVGESAGDFLEIGEAAINWSINYHGWQNVLQIVDAISYPMGTTDFRPILLHVASDEPDAVILFGFPPEWSSFLQQASEMPQLKGKIFLSTAVVDDSSFYDTVGSAGTGTFIFGGPFAAYADTSNATVNAAWNTFRQEYLAYTGHPAAILSASGYDDVWLIAYALNQAGSTNSSALLRELDTMSVPPVHLRLLEPTPQGTLFYTNPTSPLWHSPNFVCTVQEVFWNSTSNSPYTEIVWPQPYNTTSPVLGIFP